MSRLPTPGSDNNIWGEVLNDFLEVEHDATGALKRSADIDNALSLATAATNKLQSSIDGNARVRVSKNGAAVGSRRTVNFIEGSNITLTAADDSANEKVDVTIAASGTDANAVHKGDLAFNIRDYGAVGDGTADDTAAIQAALNAVPAGGG